MRFRGDAVVQHDLPVTVRAGEESVVKGRLQLGVPCEFEFSLPAPLGAGHRVNVVILGSSFKAKLTAYAHPDGNYRCKTGLLPGKFELRASTKEGYAGTREFEVKGKAKTKIRMALR